MVMLGLLSLIQMFFLPGWLIASVGLGWLPRIDQALLVAPLSIVTSYCLIASLTLTGIYTQETVLALFVFEALLVLSLMHDERNTEGAGEWMSIRDLIPDYASGLLMLLALASGMLIFLQMKTAFAGEEFLMFWDRWAEDWYHGHLPHATGYYPQMLPALLSLNYLFMGSTDEKLFACLLPLCWVILTSLIWSRMAVLLPAYKREIRWGFVLLIALAAFTENLACAYSGFSGYLVIYLVSVVGYALVLSGTTSGRKHIWLFKLTTFIAAGAAVTQISGIYPALTLPLVWFIQTGRKCQCHLLCRKLCIKAFTLITLIAGSWYLYKYGQSIVLGNTVALTWVQVPQPYIFSLRLFHHTPLITLKSWIAPLLLVTLSLLSPLGRLLLGWSLPLGLAIGLMARYTHYGDISALLPAMAIAGALGVSCLRTLLCARFHYCSG
ncbi:hypothetical protein F6R98_04555 [Candidatus Methylospira mobilis]|uniref:Glycosyltransferase RgtA/B/C/D-like domain-containing protein n=2 Tax=Candidatus Methylospira mobilis TaxID=1808979 RepID=A0A5Q0BFU6_9GAMM|nr:hypothetical protein F6R98_04555 [Candidatus Methylospira mobilis]